MLLALDQGTTSSRAILFSESGKIIGSASRAFPQHYPQPGWVEHDPMDLWDSTLGAAADLLAAHPDARPAAIGITNQRETTLLWHRKTGKPVGPAIVWQDRRTAPECRRLTEEGHGPAVTRATGLRFDPYFSGTKLRWMLDHSADARRLAREGALAFGTVDSWLLWKLTGGAIHATDPTNASRTLLFNIRSGTWDDDLLALLDIPRPLLPEVLPSAGHFGTTNLDPFPEGTPITGIAGDQQAALFGQACFTPGMAKNTYGTGCFLLLHTGAEPVASQNELLTTIAWQIGGNTEYALEGSVFVAGALFQWLRDNLELVRDVRELDALAQAVPDSDGVVMIPAFTGLGAPHWDPDARGLLIGLTRGTTKAHIARAAVEAVAIQVAEVIEAMERDAGLPLQELRVDGGASRSDPLMQFQADLLQVPVVRPLHTETTAHGAALLAGLGRGIYRNKEEIASLWKPEHRFASKPRTPSMKRTRTLWNKALHRSMSWAGSSDPQRG